MPNQFRFLAFRMQIWWDGTGWRGVFLDKQLLGWGGLLPDGSVLVIGLLDHYNEGKAATLINTIWVDLDSASELLHNLLNYRQAQSNALAVHFSCPVQLSKSGK